MGKPKKLGEDLRMGTVDLHGLGRSLEAKFQDPAADSKNIWLKSYIIQVIWMRHHFDMVWKKTQCVTIRWKETGWDVQEQAKDHQGSSMLDHQCHFPQLSQFYIAMDQERSPCSKIITFKLNLLTFADIEKPSAFLGKILWSDKTKIEPLGQLLPLVLVWEWIKQANAKLLE